MVTIIMATYNRAHFISETLQSIQNQTFSDWECLIIDDGGTDNTSEVIATFLAQDERFQYLRRPDQYRKGLPGCRNYGLDLAKGDYIVFFDDDDIVHPDNLKTNRDIILKSNTDFCHYQKQSFVTKKPVFQFLPVNIIRKLSTIDMANIVTNQIGLASCTVMWKRCCFESNRFKEELLYAEEWECYSRILSNRYHGLTIDSVLYFNRKHPESNTGEFYSDNPIRKESKKKAILLVIHNLNSKGMLTTSLLRYFVQMSLKFKEYELFESILSSLNLPTSQRIKWRLFYKLMPLNLSVYKLKKRLLKK